MNGVTDGVPGIFPCGTITFSQTSTTVRRLSAVIVSSPNVDWWSVLDVGEDALDEEVDGEEDGDDNFDGELELTGRGISEALGLWLDDVRVFDDDDWSFGEDGDVGGLAEDTGLVGDDFAGIVLRGNGVGIFEIALVAFEVSWFGQVVLMLLVDDSEGRFEGVDVDEVLLEGLSSMEGGEDELLSSVSLEVGKVSLLLIGSIGSFNNGSFGLGSVSGGVLRGGTLGLW